MGSNGDGDKPSANLLSCFHAEFWLMVGTAHVNSSPTHAPCTLGQHEPVGSSSSTLISCSESFVGLLAPQTQRKLFVFSQLSFHSLLIFQTASNSTEILSTVHRRLKGLTYGYVKEKGESYRHLLMASKFLSFEQL